MRLLIAPNEKSVAVTSLVAKTEDGRSIHLPIIDGQAKVDPDLRIASIKVYVHHKVQETNDD